MPAFNYPLQKQLASVRDALENQWTIAQQQPLVKMAGAGMDAISKAGQVFDRLYRGNVGTEPVNQGQVQIPATTQQVAGIPFGPGKTVYHGTSKSFDKFNPYYNNPNDLFGKMTHFAEDPRYAGNAYTGLDILDAIGDPMYTAAGSQRPRVIPARLDVKNALDVSSNNPTMINWDDLSKLVDTGYSGRQLEQIYGRLMQKRAGEAGHLAANKIPRNIVSERLLRDPSALSRSGFDAIKYSDNLGAGMGYKPEVWAIENPALAKGLYTGEPLGISLKPQNLERLFKQFYGGYYPSEGLKKTFLNVHGSTLIPEELRQQMTQRISSMGQRKR